VEDEVFPCGRTDDVTKPMVALGNFAKAPKMVTYTIITRTILSVCCFCTSCAINILTKFVRIIKIAIPNVGYDVAIYIKFLGASAEVIKAVTSSVMCFCLSAWHNSSPETKTPSPFLQPVVLGTVICRGLSKSLCAPDDYSTKNTQKYFKQFQSLTMIT
jgi:hypothetical protein